MPCALADILSSEADRVFTPEIKTEIWTRISETLDFMPAAEALAAAGAGALTQGGG